MTGDPGFPGGGPSERGETRAMDSILALISLAGSVASLILVEFDGWVHFVV